MEQKMQQVCIIAVQIKESHATIILLSTLFISLTTKKKNVSIPDNQVSIIEYYQNPIYRYVPLKKIGEKLEIEIDTTSTYKDIISNTESNFGRD